MKIEIFAEFNCKDVEIYFYKHCISYYNSVNLIIPIANNLCS